MTIRFSCPHCQAIAHVDDQFAGRIASCTRCGESMIVPHQTSGSPHPTVAREVTYIGDDRRRTSSRMAGILVLGGGAIALVLLILFLGNQRSHRPRAIQPRVRYGPGSMSHTTTGDVVLQEPLDRIWQALQGYYEDHGCFPPAYTTDQAGRPMHSWRALLLPYLSSPDSQLARYYDFDQPWDSPQNLRLLVATPEAFRSEWDAEPGTTHFVVVTGDPFQFPQTMFTPGRGIKWQDVTDRPETTILVARTPQAVPWTRPGADLQFSTMTMRINQGPASIGSCAGSDYAAEVLMADGSKMYLDSVHDSNLTQLIQPADGGQGRPTGGDSASGMAEEPTEE